MVNIPDAASGQFLHEGSLNWRVVLSKATTSLISFLIIIIIEDIAADTTTNRHGMSGEVTLRALIRNFIPQTNVQNNTIIPTSIV